MFSLSLLLGFSPTDQTCAKDYFPCAGNGSMHMPTYPCCNSSLQCLPWGTNYNSCRDPKYASCAKNNEWCGEKDTSVDAKPCCDPTYKCLPWTDSGLNNSKHCQHVSGPPSACAANYSACGTTRVLGPPTKECCDADKGVQCVLWGTYDYQCRPKEYLTCSKDDEWCGSEGSHEPFKPCCNPAKKCLHYDAPGDHNSYKCQ